MDATKIIAMSLCCLFGSAVSAQTAGESANAATTNGLIFLIKAEVDQDMDGLLRWEQELRDRDLTAMVYATGPVLETYPQIFKRLAQTGYEVIGGYSEICWDMPYEEQYLAMLTVKAEMEQLTGHPMQIFSCKYFSYTAAPGLT